MIYLTSFYQRREQVESSYEETMARIKTVSRPQTQTELAKLLEVSQSSVAEAKRRQSIPADW